MGVALNLYSNLEIEETECGLLIISSTMGGTVHNDKKNLVYRAMERVFDEVIYVPKGIRITQESKIPMTRGLGSSSSCKIGGMLAANVMSGRRLSYPEILNLAADMEGHPDNVGPALYGGLCISASIDGRTVVKSTKLCYDLKFAVMIPDFYVATKKSREALPQTVRLKDAADNISSALMFYNSVISGDFENLRYGVNDKIHQPYRKRYIEGYDEIFDKTYELGSCATYLSGSGPTIISILNGESNGFKSKMEQFFSEKSHKWRCLILECDNVGSVVSVI